MMADKQIATILSGGTITSMFIGGITADKKVVVFSDLVAPNMAFDDTGLGITATTVDEALTALSEVGLVVMNGNSLTPQSIATSPTKVVLFDTKVVEAGVGVTGDVALQRASTTITGIMKLRFEAFVSYASNIDITWQLYKNGVAYGDTVTLAGQGAKVFPLTLITSDNLTAGDYLELFATASATATLTVVQANGTLEKTIFKV